MPSHQLKLYYFPGVRGRAEHIRQLLKLANVPFEDVDIPFDQWPSFKPETPLGQMPVLEVDGVRIGQSVAIARYLAEEYGFTPKDTLAKAKLDMIVDQISDTFNSKEVRPWPAILLGMTPCDDKGAFFRDNVRPQLDALAGVVEKYLVENGKEQTLSGDKLTWADIYAAECFSKFVDYGEKDCLEAYPHIQELIARVHNEPAIKKHIGERKPTPF